MKIKTFLKAVVIKAKQSRISGKKLSKSYVSLFLVFILAVTSTVAWFVQHQAATLNANSEKMMFQSASSLRINKDNTSTNRIYLDNVVLDEASSVDGRNVYFPVGESFSNDTSKMFFREANVGDENVHYVYKDFHLKGSSGNTPVYIKGYEVTISSDASGTRTDDGYDAVYHDELDVTYTGTIPTNQVRPRDHCPIRIAFISDSADDYIVFDPSAQFSNYVDNCDAVYLTDENGVPTTKRSAAHAFSEYYYGAAPLFTIPGGQDLPVTVVVWLEGTEGDCDQYMGKHIRIDIDIESNFPAMEEIYFVDDTIGDTDNSANHWINNKVPNNSGEYPIIACTYKDPFADQNEIRYKTVVMDSVPNTANPTWKAKIPKKAVTDISFYRLNPYNGSDQATIFNSWHTYAGVNGQLNPNLASRHRDWFDSNFPVPTGSTSPMNLQETRQRYDNDNNIVNETVYTATHGNGYSTTTSIRERLSPCIGYWGHVTSGASHNSGSDSGNTGGGSSGGDTSATYDIGISLNMLDWVASNIRNNNYSMHFKTSDGGDYTFTNNPSNNLLEQHFDLSYGTEITGFYYRNGYNGNTTDFRVSRIYSVTQTFNIVYDQQSTDQHDFVLR